LSKQGEYIISKTVKLFSHLRVVSPVMYQDH